MQKQQLLLHKTIGDNFRCIIKTKHARMIYLELSANNENFIVKECYYIDRIGSGKYCAAPQKLITREFNKNKILNIIATQLDRLYYGIEYSDNMSELSTDEFIKYKLNELKRGYKFLIFVGEGELIDGLPSTLTTRLANRIHRKIYMKITYYKNNLGVVEAYYYDRCYKARSRVTPQMLSTVFVEYSRSAIIEFVNRELNCAFTDLIITDNSIDIKNNTFALCGNI